VNTVNAGANQIPQIGQDSFELVHADLNKAAASATYVHTTFWQDVFTRLFKNKGAVAGMVLIALIVLFSILAPVFSPYSYKEQNLDNNYLPPKIPVLENIGIFDGKDADGTDQYAARELDENVYYFFGTDSFGRDLWTRLWNGTRISLLIAILAVAIDLVVGMSYGLISGYFGGKVDFVMQRIVEVINGIPQLVIITLFALILEPGMVSIILALLISGWIPMSRVCRAQVLKQKEQEYVLAARTLGVSNLKIIFKEIVPNVLGQVVIMSMFSIPSAIFTESYLAFIGLGVRAPMASLGSLVSTGYKSFLVYPFLVIIPVTVLAVLMVSFNLFADGLRDAFDPTMKEM
jgi:oligopeptide transport system permease protein